MCLSKRNSRVHSGSIKGYIIGALKNRAIPRLANTLHSKGFEVFADWFAPGKDADQNLRKYARQRGWGYKQALGSPAARHVFDFDLHHIDTSDVGVMLWPAGRSAHMELGYFRGQGKPAFILFDREPSRLDVMHCFATDVFFSESDLLRSLKKLKRTRK